MEWVVVYSYLNITSVMAGITLNAIKRNLSRVGAVYKINAFIQNNLSEQLRMSSYIDES